MAYGWARAQGLRVIVDLHTVRTHHFNAVNEGGHNTLFTDPKAQGKVELLRPIAAELGCSMAQLAIAWCAVNPHVSTVITGASRVSQVIENFEAIDVLDRLTPEVMARIATAVA